MVPTPATPPCPTITPYPRPCHPDSLPLTPVGVCQMGPGCLVPKLRPAVRVGVAQTQYRRVPGGVRRTRHFVPLDGRHGVRATAGWMAPSARTGMVPRCPACAASTFWSLAVIAPCRKPSHTPTPQSPGFPIRSENAPSHFPSLPLTLYLTPLAGTTTNILTPRIVDDSMYVLRGLQMVQTVRPEPSSAEALP